MKRLSYAMACASVIFFASCSDDDPGVDPNIEIANNQNLTEERSITTSELSQGVEIFGASKETGTAPAPTGNLAFQVESNSQEAFQATGFDIEFTTSTEIAGAYVQLKDVDGNNAEGYFDIPATSINANGRRRSVKNGPIKPSPFGKRKAEGSLSIEVDFSTAVLPGQFCYEICVYDEAGNISAPQEVCVEVEAWGGNAEIVGEWVFVRSEPINENEIDLLTINCDSGQTLEEVPETKELQNDWIFVLNADGSYYEQYFVEEEPLDEEQTAANCSPVYEEAQVTEDDKYLGFWAYNEEAETLTVVDFESIDNVDGDSFEYEEGSVYLEGVTVEVINGELVIMETEIEDGIEVMYKEIFRRR